jgi:AcrR family transcriptional regulator
MALYHHVPSKAVLLDRIRESVIAVAPDVRSSFDETVAREGQPALTEDRIIAAGLETVREHTASGLSMRALAKRLGVSPMALYHHVQNKAELVERLRDAVASRMTLTEPSAEHWQQQMRDYLVDGIMNMAEYPGLVRTVGGRTLSEGDRRAIRQGISILLAAGFEPKEAASAIAACNVQAFGLLIVADGIAQGRMPRPRRRRGPASRGEADVGAHMRAIDFRTVVEYSVDTMLRGLAARLEESKARAPKAASRRSPAKRSR